LKYSDPGYKKWPPTAQTVVCLELENGQFVQTKINVAIEKDLSLYLNGRRLIKVSVTPVMQKEFIVGYLFGQGFIDGRTRWTRGNHR
jgi:FdhD protein